MIDPWLATDIRPRSTFNEGGVRPLLASHIGRKNGEFYPANTFRSGTIKKNRA
ncbi:MAG: hypothetical protein GX307_01995 [Euryarchaeota archaeon]|nr:hypothetical protein [Euryarchaeota archaeon]